MISLKHNFLFIHIPKTAGNSIQNVLKPYSDEEIVCLAPHHDGIERFEIRSNSYVIHKHATLREYQEQIGAERISRLLKFTCVRNPWERLISYYFSPHRGAVHWNRDQFVELVKQVSPISHFVSLGSEGDQQRTPFENMNVYLRFDKLDQDFERLCLKVGIPPTPLPHRNTSIRQHFFEYLDTELIELVRKRFHQEISYFGFQLEDWSKTYSAPRQINPC